jgi:hypothetical protein
LMAVMRKRGSEAYWIDQADECLVEATNALGWQNPGEMDFDEALIRVFHQLAEGHGIRLP